jgi:hypothetical protein
MLPSAKLLSKLSHNILFLIGFDFNFANTSKTQRPLWSYIVFRIQNVLVICASLISIFWSPYVMICGMILLSSGMNGKLPLMFIAIVCVTSIASIHVAYATIFLMRLTATGK